METKQELIKKQNKIIEEINELETDNIAFQRQIAWRQEQIKELYKQFNELERKIYKQD